MSHETYAFEEDKDDGFPATPVVMLIVTGTHDVSRLVQLLHGGSPNSEQRALGERMVRQLRRHPGGQAALQLLAEHGGMDYVGWAKPVTAGDEHRCLVTGDQGQQCRKGKAMPHHHVFDGEQPDPGDDPLVPIGPVLAAKLLGAQIPPGVVSQPEPVCAHKPGVHCSRCIESDPAYLAHLHHNGISDDCPYCPTVEDTEASGVGSQPDSGPRVWRNPDDPNNRAPDGVHRVHDADGHVWEMKLGGDWVCRSGRTPNVYAWFALMAQYGPLTEVVVDQPGGGSS